MCILGAGPLNVKPAGSPSAPLLAGISSGNLNMMFVSFIVIELEQNQGFFFFFFLALLTHPSVCLVTLMILPGMIHRLLRGHHTPIPGGLPTPTLAHGQARWPLRVKALEHNEHKNLPLISNPSSASDKRHHHLRNPALSIPSHSSQERHVSLSAQLGFLTGMGLSQQFYFSPVQAYNTFLPPKERRPCSPFRCYHLSPSTHGVSSSSTCSTAPDAPCTGRWAP